MQGHRLAGVDTDLLLLVLVVVTATAGPILTERFGRKITRVAT